MSDKDIGDELVIVNFQLTKEMKRQLKIDAAVRGKSMRELLEELIAQHLKESRDKNLYRLPED